MILPDVNLLVFAYNEDAPRHVEAREWWMGLMRDRIEVGIPWAVVLGFIRLVTYARVTPRPLTPGAAVAIVRTWLDRSHVDVIAPGPRHLDIVESLFEATAVAGRLSTDVHLAAIAIERDAELMSNDSDFARMPGLRWSNPLAAPA